MKEEQVPKSEVWGWEKKGREVADSESLSKSEDEGNEVGVREDWSCEDIEVLGKSEDEGKGVDERENDESHFG